MDINPNNINKKNKGNVSQSKDIAPLLLSHLGQSVEISPDAIKQACKEAAMEAFKLGETNDTDTYEDEMEILITDVLTKKIKRRKMNL